MKTETQEKMTVEVWGDITCSFCYMAKKSFEIAHMQFEGKENIEVIWRSFELLPHFETIPNKRLPQFLSEVKRVDLATVKGMTDQVENMAKEIGLIINSDRIVPANSNKAHRLIHLAKAHGLQEKAKDTLFEAYFVHGLNIDDLNTLITMAIGIGLDKQYAESVLKTNRYKTEVLEDITRATQHGITSVPTYVFNHKIKLSGLQDSGTYLRTLKETFASWKMEMKSGVNSQIMSCDLNGTCN